MKVTLELDEADARALSALLRNEGSEGAEEVAGQIEAQLPRPEEPTEFGSMARASDGPGSDRDLWIRTRSGGWLSDGGVMVGDYSLLYDVEVLRVGVGTALPSAERVKELVRDWEQSMLHDGSRYQWGPEERRTALAEFAAAVRGEPGR